MGTAEARLGVQAPPPPQDPSPLRGTLGSSLRSPAEGEGHDGFLPPPEKDLERLPMHETQETQVQSLGWKDPLEEEMATASSILAWKIPWMEEPGGLQSMGSQRVRHD